ncbi:hypothetical protein DC498_01070 [Terrimonas sp.]|nr:hypothetical protein DC498_01070 [Terrimonas sp.]
MHKSLQVTGLAPLLSGYTKGGIEKTSSAFFSKDKKQRFFLKQVICNPPAAETKKIKAVFFIRSLCLIQYLY